MAINGAATARQAITRLQGVIKEAVHVKIYPRPRNLAESREVLRILQQYGEVAMYKHLKYESVAPAHNTVLAIYKSAASAQKLVDASPITFELQDGKYSSRPLQGNLADLFGADGRGSERIGVRLQEKQTINNKSQDAANQVSVGDGASQGSSGGLNCDSASSSTLNPQKAGSPSDAADRSRDFLYNITKNLLSPQAPDISPQISIPSSAKPLETPPPPRPPRRYQLTISPSNLDHEKYIERQSYFGGFNPDTSSMMAEDLEGRVPMPGLVDCQIRRPEAPARVVAKWRGRAAQRTTTLKELWENGKRERGEMQ